METCPGGRSPAGITDCKCILCGLHPICNWHTISSTREPLFLDSSGGWRFHRLILLEATLKKIAILAAAAMLSTSAFAADLGVISQPAPLGFEPVNDWTGFCAGVFGSIGAADFELVPAGLPGAGFLSTGRGALGGVQVGYDYQLDLCSAPLPTFRFPA